MPGPILIVDDSAFTRRSLIRDLPPGMADRVVEASDGYEALEAFERVDPCLLFLDVSMPRMGGLEVLEALRGRRHAARVVVVTSERGPEVERRARALGAHELLPKPWRREDVLRALREAGLLQRER